MSEQVFITECELCHKKQKTPPLSIGTIAEPGKDLDAYLAKIYLHIGTCHRREYEAGKQIISRFQQFLALSQVKSEDPAVNRYYDELRDSILALFGITVTQPR